MDIRVKDLDGKEWMIPEDEAEDVKELHTDEVKSWYDDWESREGRKGMKKKHRRGFAGDDVTDNRDYQEEVVPEKDESYIVEDTDSPHEIEEESEVITDDHQVVIDEESGDEEDFVAESEDGDAETIDEDGEGREGRRGKKRRGSKKSRRGESEDEESDEDEDEDEKEREGRRGKKRRGSKKSRRGESEDEESDEDEDEDEKEREGRRGKKRRGMKRRGTRRTRKGDSVLGSEVADLVMNEAGDTEEVELPEPDESEREGRRGAVYGGRSPEHQASIQAAVSIAMRDRRL